VKSLYSKATKGILNVELELNMSDLDNDFCTANVVVTEDITDEICLIFLHDENEVILRLYAVLMFEELKKTILEKYKTVSEVNRVIYGDDK
jgi:hypothetical protein